MKRRIVIKPLPCEKMAAGGVCPLCGGTGWRWPEWAYPAVGESDVGDPVDRLYLRQQRWRAILKRNTG